MKEKIIELLTEFPKDKVENFANYVLKLQDEKKPDGSLKNAWAKNRTAQVFADAFKKVAGEGLWIDGKHITLQSTGVSYDYIALKNKMLLVYPESKIDVAVVNDGDEFSFENTSGKVVYNHKLTNPFAESTEKSIVGAYAVIKNSRGEYLTVMSKEEVAKSRKVAKTDYIWKQWFKEMVLKTILKKAVKIHFDDVYSGIEEEDNKENDITNPLTLEQTLKSEIDAYETVDQLKSFIKRNKGKGKDLLKYAFKKLDEIEKNKK